VPGRRLRREAARHRASLLHFVDARLVARCVGQAAEAKAFRLLARRDEAGLARRQRRGEDGLARFRSDVRGVEDLVRNNKFDEDRPTYHNPGLGSFKLTGIAAASGTESRSSEPYGERAKAEQPRPSTTIEKTMHSSFDEQSLPKPKPERKPKPKPKGVGVGSGETDSHCGAACGQAKVGLHCGCKKERARTHTEDCLPNSAPFFLPFSSSTLSISAAAFVSTSSSGSYLLETFVYLTSPLRPLLRRGFDGVVQSVMPCARAISGGVNIWALAPRPPRPWRSPPGLASPQETP